MSEPRDLILISEARKALASVRTFDDAKQLRDKAAAAYVFAKANLSFEAAQEMAEIKLRAERTAGRFLKHMGFGDHGGDRRSSCKVQLETLGVNKSQSHRWHKVRAVPRMWHGQRLHVRAQR